MQVAAVVDGPDEAAFAENIDSAQFSAAAAVLLLGGILIGLWRGTTNTPGASLADVVVLMGSPVSARLQFGLLVMRTSLQNGMIISLWALAAGSGLVMGVDDNWISVRLLFSTLTVVLLSEFLRYAVWIGTEQVVARSPVSGNQLRQLIRRVTLLFGVGIAGYLVWPMLDGARMNWREALS